MATPGGREEYAAIVRALRPILRAHGVQEIEAQLNVKKGYFADVEYSLKRGRRKAIRLDVVLDALQLVDVDAGAFFWKALGGRRPAPVEEFRQLAANVRLPEAVQRALDGPTEKPAITEVDLRELDEARFGDPKEALKRTEAVASRVPHELRAQYLGVLGSSFRCCDQIPEAAASLSAAFAGEIEVNRRLQVHADLLLRARIVASYLGENALAIELAQIALTEFTVAADEFGIACALTELGTAYYLIGRGANADQAWRTASRQLEGHQDRAASRYLYAVYQGRSIAAHAAGDLERASDFCAQARPLVAFGRSDWKHRQAWLEARLAGSAGRVDDAEELYGEVFRGLSSTFPSDAARAGTELVKLLNQNGQDAQAKHAAIRMCRLFGALGKEDRPAETSLRDLISSAAEGPRLRESLLDRVLAELAEARARATARARMRLGLSH